ncbi:MAG: OsmC family protein [Cyclobacteriaceae bacterium]|nr:OsmC family protein [Cyclobacteriaceae bacterium]
METMTKTVNGFDVEAMTGTVAAIQATPAIASFEFRATNKWISGAHNRSYVQGFYGAGAEDTSRTEPFVFDNDEPPILLGRNLGANPGEVILQGLLSCMTTAMVLLATARGIEVEAVSSRIEGDVDVQGFLGLDPNVEKGFKQIRVTFDIEGATEEKKQELINLAMESPIFNSLVNPVDVRVSVN